MDIEVEQRAGIFTGRFTCMASPCEILVETGDQALAGELLSAGAAEARRIETKFSRYRDDNIIHRINHADGETIEVDEETARLLDFAARCHDISDGLFDVTSGILRLAWKFDGSDRLPDQSVIDGLLDRIGWSRLDWRNPHLTMPAGMQLDLGGIGKEYAVDRTLGLLQQQTDSPVLVNFGGDLHCSGPRGNGEPWTTGIEDPHSSGAAVNMLQLFHGALATSGDAFRFLEKDGVRYGHILNPLTGWPARNAPASVTVAAENCIEAGILSTLAILHEAEAEAFLKSQQVRYWVFHHDR